ncbi:MAG: hypothetical protein VX733_02840 [Candidatus Latescibacterota bacterium]|nr:hypothetical protein [Candidatus Latescibacterota bacterium]
MRWVLPVAVLLLSAAMSSAQMAATEFDSSAIDDTLAAADDSTTSPLRELWRSAVLPGWGQWSMGHEIKAVLFAGAAAGWLAAGVREAGRVSEAPAGRQEDRAARRNTRFLLYFTTATAAAVDAYVDAHLRDVRPNRPGLRLEGNGAQLRLALRW